MIDIQSPADGVEMLVAPDFPVALVVAAVPVIVPLAPLNESQLSYPLKLSQSKLLTFQIRYQSQRL
jgi:hypothetical protein